MITKTSVTSNRELLDQEIKKQIKLRIKKTFRVGKI